LNAWKAKGLKIVNQRGDVINTKISKPHDNSYQRK